jgi:hypothetical protein
MGTVSRKNETQNDESTLNEEDYDTVVIDGVTTMVRRELKQMCNFADAETIDYVVRQREDAQKARITSEGQLRQWQAQNPDKQNEMLEYLVTQNKGRELESTTFLGIMVEQHPIGKWLGTIRGIGPALAGQLIATFRVKSWRCYGDNEKDRCSCEDNRCTSNYKDAKGNVVACGYEVRPYVGAWYRFAGVTGNLEHDGWAKGEKRKWSANAKKLLYLVGQSFVKVSNSDKEGWVPTEGQYNYGAYYRIMKDQEWIDNVNGANAEYIEKKRAKGIKMPGKGTQAELWYSGKLDPEWVRAQPAFRGDTGSSWPQGVKQYPLAEEGKGVPMIPPDQVDKRACRKAYKMFLSHMHEVMYRIEFGGEDPPLPYIIAHDEGHNQFIPAPNQDIFDGYVDFQD